MAYYSPIFTRRGSCPNPSLNPTFRRGSLGPLDLDIPLFCNAFPRRCFINKDKASVDSRNNYSRRYSDAILPQPRRCSLPAVDQKPQSISNRRSSLAKDSSLLSDVPHRRASLVKDNNFIADTSYRRASLAKDDGIILDSTNRRSSFVSDRRPSLANDVKGPTNVRRPSFESERRTAWIADRRLSMMSKSSFGNDLKGIGGTGKVSPISTDVGKVSGRRFSAITAPKELHELYKSKRFALNDSLSVVQGSESGFTVANDNEPAKNILLPKIPSVTSISDIDEKADVMTSVEDKFDELGLYPPKPCWCLRCQIMMCMYNTKDERLAVWGHYPCFRR